MCGVNNKYRFKSIELIKQTIKNSTHKKVIEFIKVVEISKKLFYDFINNKVKINHETALTIAEALETEIKELFYLIRTVDILEEVEAPDLKEKYTEEDDQEKKQEILNVIKNDLTKGIRKMISKYDDMLCSEDYFDIVAGFINKV